MTEEHIKAMYSRIFKEVEKESITVDDKEDGIGAPVEEIKSVQTTIEPAAELKALYKGYASKKDDQLLAGLSHWMYLSCTFMHRIWRILKRLMPYI